MTSQCCEYCGKKYVRKQSYIKHVLLCEILRKSKHEVKCYKEENYEIPSARELYNVVQELVLKCDKMEKEMCEMRQYINKKKKKVDISEWLNKNNIMGSNKSVLDWVQNWKVDEEVMMEVLSSSSIIDTFQHLLKLQISTDNQSQSSTDAEPLASEFVPPIYGCSQTPNSLYIYELGSGEEEEERFLLWKKCDNDDFSKIVKYIHKKIVNTIITWSIRNEREIATNVKTDDMYSKIMLKTMNVDLNSSAFVNKIKTTFYQLLKNDTPVESI